MNKAVNIELPWWQEGLYRPNRYKALRGGRGSGKSYAVTDRLLRRCFQSRRKILCGREFQNSISESVLSLLIQRIDELGFTAYFQEKNNKIFGPNGSEFIFKGFRNNTQSIKSMNGLTDLWIEEAQTVSKSSFDTLVPTIRAPDSEIYITYNPLHEDDPIHTMFGPNGTYVDDTYSQLVNWRDNPHWPEVLEKERLRLMAADMNLYRHVYEGDCLLITDAQIFADKFSVAEFNPEMDWNGPYYGIDFGFSTDPSAAVKLWIYDNVLFVEYEFSKRKIEINHLANRLIEACPGIQHHVSRADSAKPDTISYLKSHGLPKIKGAEKGPGSVESGIEFIRSFDHVIIHPRCTETAREFTLYSYKTDKLTGDPLPVVLDMFNHNIDAIRYALEPLSKAAKSGMGLLLPTRYQK